MKVLILHGSARRNGNTGTLITEFMKGSSDSGHKVERIELMDQTIKDCLGCQACQINGGSCVQKDDMQEIYPKMLEADIIVLASPIYYYTWTSLMKRTIDRTFALNQVLAHKTFYLISACAAPEPKYTKTMMDSFYQYVGCFQGEGIAVGGSVIGYGTNGPTDVKDTEAMKQAYHLGKNIVS